MGRRRRSREARDDLRDEYAEEAGEEKLARIERRRQLLRRMRGVGEDAEGVSYRE